MLERKYSSILREDIEVDQIGRRGMTIGLKEECQHSSLVNKHSYHTPAVLLNIFYPRYPPAFAILKYSREKFLAWEGFLELVLVAPR